MRFISGFGNCFKKRLRGEDESDGGGGNTWELLIGLRILEAATYGFSKVNRLGPGGFGPVYKGLMPDGQEVTIKKLSVNSKQGVPEFVNEVKLLLKIQHRNLVTLLGCCAEGPEKMLVYEYLPNKSLGNFLLVWLGFFLGVDTHLNTLRISGTRGYMVPGYAMHGYLSVKTDVFSFGVLVLEIVSGRKNYELLSEEKADLLIYTWMLFREGKAMKIIDLNLKTYNLDEVDKKISCVKAEGQA